MFVATVQGFRVMYIAFCVLNTIQIMDNALLILKLFKLVVILLLLHLRLHLRCNFLHAFIDVLHLLLAHCSLKRGVSPGLVQQKESVKESEHPDIHMEVSNEEIGAFSPETIVAFCK